MHFLESLRLSLDGLKSNKMRSLLTMLGIIIGISAVIGILTVGDGLSGYITSTMSDMGASSIGLSLQSKAEDDPRVMSATMMGMMSVDIEKDDLISPEMIDDMREKFDESIKAISLSQNVAAGKANDGHLYANVSVLGVNDEYFSVNDIELLSGRFLKESDDASNRMVCVVSDKFVKNMFDSDFNKALGSEVRVETASGKYRFLIVGVYKYEMTMMNISFAAEKDVSTSLFIPLSTAKYLSGADSGFSSITVQANDGEDCSSLAKKMEDFLNRYYKNNESYRVTSLSMESMIESMNSIMNTLSIAISVIAAISLLVGGIGVMNIMLVSVTERTREIGTRKALGATNANIRLQFVAESAMLCLVGGVLGIVLGTVMGYVGSNLLGAPNLPSFSSIALAVGFSLAVGIFFGYYPASKAAKLDPIEALRYE